VSAQHVPRKPEQPLIDSNDYLFLTALLRERSGLALGAGKEYLIESRLPAVAKAYGLRTLGELVRLLRDSPHDELEKAVCDAMTTGETLFFRDGAPFELLRAEILPALAERCRDERRALRIWSAAAATGQEPYSVAILIDQLASVLQGVRVELLATDFSTAAINRARRGAYSELEVQRGLTPELLATYFEMRDNTYTIANTLRRRVIFGEFNLLDSYAALGTFDVILCRNVLLYFDAPTKKDVMERMASILNPGGYFFLGSTETSFGVTDRLTRVSAAPTPVHIRTELMTSAG